MQISQQSQCNICMWFTKHSLTQRYVEKKKFFFLSFFRMCDMLVKRSDRDLSNDSIFNRNDQKLQELHQK